MKKIILALILISLTSLSEVVVTESQAVINSKEQNFTQNLATAPLSATTTFSIADTGFLSIVSLHFSAAPASAETISVWRDSRAGANYDTLLARYVTVAGTTTDVTFVFSNVIPIAETDQVRVTCTNDSVGDPTVSVSVVLDPAVRNGNGVSIYSNGALIISQYQHDYHWHFGDVIPDANQQFGAFYSDFTQLGAPVTNPTAGTRRLGVDSVSGELSVRKSDGTIVSLENTAAVVETDPTLTNDGAVTIGSGAVDPTVLTFNSDGGVDGAWSYSGANDRMSLDSTSLLSLSDSTTATSRLGQRLAVDVAANYGGASFTTWSDTTDNASFFDFSRSFSDTPGTHVALSTGQGIGYLVFRGSDGTQFLNGAAVIAEADDAWGTNDAPGRLRFVTVANGGIAQTTRMTINSAGHIVYSSAAAPVVSACGVGPTIVGNDMAGHVTAGTGVITSCTLTFNIAWAVRPVCTVNNESAIQLTRGVSTTTTLVIDSGTAITSQVLNYHCFGV